MIIENPLTKHFGQIWFCFALFGASDARGYEGGSLQAVPHTDHIFGSFKDEKELLTWGQISGCFGALLKAPEL